MSLYCEATGWGGSFQEWDGESGWAWYGPYSRTFSIMGRRVRCCSCGEFCKPLTEGHVFPRFRAPKSDMEQNIHGDEVNLACWYHCETCVGLADRLEELGFGHHLGDNLIDLVKNDYQQYVEFAKSENCSGARP